jgi:hypothetical protein
MAGNTVETDRLLFPVERLGKFGSNKYFSKQPLPSWLGRRTSLPER